MSKRRITTKSKHQILRESGNDLMILSEAEMQEGFYEVKIHSRYFKGFVVDHKKGMKVVKMD